MDSLLETAGRYINRHSQTIEQNARDISQLNSTIAENGRDISHLRLKMDEILQLFAELAVYQRQSADEMR
jgi:flagellar biosynthesis chaperone FliJ